jgi:hypothetical protein
MVGKIIIAVVCKVGAWVVGKVSVEMKTNICLLNGR